MQGTSCLIWIDGGSDLSAGGDISATSLVAYEVYSSITTMPAETVDECMSDEAIPESLYRRNLYRENLPEELIYPLA